jgi:hypothetical protein
MKIANFDLLERGIPMLLNVLCKDSSTTKDLDRHPGLTKLFANILDFVFEFDYLKVNKTNNNNQIFSSINAVVKIDPASYNTK